MRFCRRLIASRSGGKRRLAAGRLAVLDVKSFPIPRHWYIVQRQGKRLSAVAARFREFVIGEAGQVWQIPGGS